MQGIWYMTPVKGLLDPGKGCSQRFETLCTTVSTLKHLYTVIDHRETCVTDTALSLSLPQLYSFCTLIFLMKEESGWRHPGLPTHCFSCSVRDQWVGEHSSETLSTQSVVLGSQLQLPQQITFQKAFPKAFEVQGTIFSSSFYLLYYSWELGTSHH